MYRTPTFFAFAAILSGCAVSPYSERHSAAPRPAPPPAHRRQSRRLQLPPSVPGGECSEAEFPLFLRLEFPALDSPGLSLQTLGIIQDHKFIPIAGAMADQGWLTAINSRQRLVWSQQFSTPSGPRIAWLFIRGSGGGSQAARIPCTALLTTADHQILTFRPTTSWLAVSPPSPQTSPDSLVLQIPNRVPPPPSSGNTASRYPTDLFRFTTSSIEISSATPLH